MIIFLDDLNTFPGVTFVHIKYHHHVKYNLFISSLTAASIELSKLSTRAMLSDLVMTAKVALSRKVLGAIQINLDYVMHIMIEIISF